MAEMRTFNTKIKLRIDTLEAWQSSTATLMPGEVALATVAASAGTGLTEPVVMAKIGMPDEDGNDRTFSQLPWAFHAKASDVLAACKSEEALTAFVNDVIADAGIATDEAMQALAGRVTTAEGKITTLEGKMTTAEGKITANEGAIAALEELVGDDKVVDQINAAITALDLGNTYEKKGEAAKVQTALDEYKTANDKAVADNKAAIEAEAAAARAAEKKNSDAIDAIKDGTTIDSFADVESALAGKEAAGAAEQALTDAKAYADGLAKNYDAAGSAAAAEQAAKDYADGLADNYDAAGSAEDALEAAKGYTDAEIAEMVGDKSVQAQIADLKLAETYDAKGAAAAAESAAKSHATGLNNAMNTRVEALEAIDHDHENKAVLDGITADKVSAWDAAEQNAKDYADGLDEAMDGRVAAIEAKFGNGEGNVEAQISKAVADEAALREAADAELAADIKAITDDYLVEADKTELSGKITTLEGVVGDVTSIADYVATAVQAEETRATGVEAGLEGRLAAVEGDYLKAADKEALQTQINTIMSNPDAEGAINSINEFTQYVKDHGTIAEGMRTDINKNADDIAAEKERAEGVEGGLNTRLTAAEAAIETKAATSTVEALAGTVATKAAQADLEAATGRITTVEGKVTTLEGEMDAVEGRATVLEGLVGDTKVDTQIKSAVDPIAGRVATLEGKAHEHANATELAKFVDGDKAKLDTAVQTVSAGSGLKATKTGTEVAIDFNEECTFIFDCGSSAE